MKDKKIKMLHVQFLTFISCDLKQIRAIQGKKKAI